MIIKSVKLNNIRSYLDEKITFPIGSTLLAGDVGSGKSSILLAIEFALFGVRRVHLPGGALLRNGKKEGSVELRMDIDGKDIIIKRSLKRGKKEIKQESGYIIVNDVKKEGTPIELKSFVLDLLGYPKELVTKTKDLVYRYTVYTPQEEMKHILLDEEGSRLDTLRKVFNIDKYKRIKENSLIFVRSIKEKRKEYEGRIADLEEKKKEFKEKEKEVKKIDTEIKEILPKLESIKKEVIRKKDNIKKTEEGIKQLNNLKRDLQLKDLDLKRQLEHSDRNKKENRELEKNIKNIEEELKGKEKIKIEDLQKEINDKEKEIEELEKKIKEIERILSEFKIKKKTSDEIKEKILKLEKCPVCEQDVGSEHKKNINEREQEKIKKIEEHIKKHEEELRKKEKNLVELKKNIKDLNKKEKENYVLKLKFDSLEEKKKKTKKIISLQEEIKKNIDNINSEKRTINEKLEGLKDIEEDYGKLKKEFDGVLEEQKKNEIKKAEFEMKKNTIVKLIESLDKEINEKLKIKESLTKLQEFQNWLEEYFINLMDVMEKHIMLKIYREFNELFQNWFNVLIEDETINIRLDDSFSPVVEQNGYEISVENLSGGEKTSCALAYRLALNKVINDFIGDIKTKNLIILDEPTDGFSSEQLDKIRVVLDQLNMKQVIIVSHESKIESFVDNVIGINKEEHVSKVL